MKLEKKTIEIENILLDPNNPRFADVSDGSITHFCNAFLPCCSQF
jgi:hypothetical protein